ncbi:TlpA family protein disulfide reductase [Planctomycetaceae bacterium SH139]
MTKQFLTRNRRFACVSPLVLVTLLAGCWGEQETVIERVGDGQPISPSAEVSHSGSLVASAGDLAELDIPEGPPTDPLVQVEVSPWDEIMAAVKSAGKPVVLDVWSLNCQPCLREFPGLVKLNTEFGDQLSCISANIDYDGRRTHPPENYLTDVMGFLQSTSARTENYICATPSEDVYIALEVVSIPAVLVFDAAGNEVARFVDEGETIGFTYEEHVMPAVRKLLADSTPSEDAGSVSSTNPPTAGEASPAVDS